MPKQGYFDDTGVMQPGLLWPESLLQVSCDLFLDQFHTGSLHIWHTKNSIQFTNENPASKKGCSFFLFQNANALSVRCNDDWKHLPCIPQTDAYDQLHLEMMQVGKKRESMYVCRGGNHKNSSWNWIAEGEK